VAPEAEEATWPRYQVTVDFLRYLGLSSVSELPEYASLAKDQNLSQAITATENNLAPPAQVRSGLAQSEKLS